MTKPNIKKKAIIEALRQSLGIVTDACKKVEISRNTYYRWLQEDEEFKKEVDNIAEESIDFVESQLYKQIEENNVTSIIFYLKTKGRNRGYGDTEEKTSNLTFVVQDGRK